MSTRSTLGLAATLAVMLVAYWLIGRIDRSVSREAAEVEKVFTFSSIDVASISIARIGEDLVEAARDDTGQWAITIPYRHIPANQPLWNALSAAISSLTNERTIDEKPNNLEDFQLDSPLLTVIVGTANDPLMQLAFGSLDPTQVNRYAQVGDGPVFLAPAGTFSMLDRGLEDLRDRSAFTNLEEGISRIDFVRRATSGAEEIEDPDIAARAMPINESYQIDDTGMWRMTRPVEAVLRQDGINALAAQLRLAAGRGYIDEPESLSDYGLDPPFAEVTVHSMEGGSQTLLLGWLSGGDKGGGLFVKREDSRSVFVAELRLFLLLPAAPDDFREKHLFTHEAKSLKTIRYRDAHNELLLEQDEAEGWRLVEPPVDDTDQIAVSMYVAMLKSIEGESFPQVQQVASLETPRLSLEFTYSDDTAPSAIHVGGPLPSSNPVTFYARQDIGVVSAISFDSLRMLQTKPFDFRIKTIFPFRPGDVQGIDLLFEDRRYVFRRTQGTWILEEPRGARLESQSDVRALLRAFVDSRASGIADSTSVAGALGADGPMLRVSFDLVGEAGEDSSITFGPVEVGERTDPNSRLRFLSVEGKSTIYLVDQSLINDVRDAVQGVVFSNP